MDGKLIDRSKLTDALIQILGKFVLDRDVKAIFEEMLLLLLDLTDSKYGFIGDVFYDKDAPYLKTHAITNIAWNKETKDFYEREAPTGMEFRNLKSLFGHVMEYNTPVISNSPYVDKRRGGLPKGHPALNAFLGLPFHFEGEMTGMVGIANRPDGYNEQIIQELKPFLDACASLIEGFKIIKRKKEISKNLKDTVLKLENQNEKLNEFTYIISHDVRKHASNLKMLATILNSDDFDENSEVTKEMITTSISHLSDTVNYISEIIEVSRRPSLKRRDVQLKQVIDNILSSFSLELSPFTLSLDIDDNILLYLEPVYLNSICENLISNAIKYSSKQAPSITISTQQKDGFTEIHFADNGLGIDLDLYGDRLFKMFATFHGHQDSKGLGLFLVKKYLDAMSGDIRVESTLGKGSLFVVKLPNRYE